MTSARLASFEILAPGRTDPRPRRAPGNHRRAAPGGTTASYQRDRPDCHFGAGTAGLAVWRRFNKYRAGGAPIVGGETDTSAGRPGSSSPAGNTRRRAGHAGGRLRRDRAQGCDWWTWKRDVVLGLCPGSAFQGLLAVSGGCVSWPGHGARFDDHQGGGIVAVGSGGALTGEDVHEDDEAHVRDDADQVPPVVNTAWRGPSTSDRRLSAWHRRSSIPTATSGIP
jgi:hypothetical protein